MVKRECKLCQKDISDLAKNAQYCPSCAKKRRKETRESSRKLYLIPPCARKNRELYQYAKWIGKGVLNETITKDELQALFQKHKREATYDLQGKMKKQCILKILAQALEIHRCLYLDNYRVYSQEDWILITKVGATTNDS